MCNGRFKTANSSPDHHVPTLWNAASQLTHHYAVRIEHQALTNILAGVIIVTDPSHKASLDGLRLALTL
jgi:hypothetical protein